jgi:excisionase family DNA binding protein
MKADLLTADELGERLKLAGRTLRAWHQSGRIPAAIHVGRVVRFREADVVRALEKASRKGAAR